jgi:hypothetical protein
LSKISILRGAINRCRRAFHAACWTSCSDIPPPVYFQ